MEKTLCFLKKELDKRVSGHSQRHNTIDYINDGNSGSNNPLNLDNLSHAHVIKDGIEHPRVVNRRIRRLSTELEDQMDQTNGSWGDFYDTMQRQITTGCSPL